MTTRIWNSLTRMSPERQILVCVEQCFIKGDTGVGRSPDAQKMSSSEPCMRIVADVIRLYQIE